MLNKKSSWSVQQTKLGLLCDQEDGGDLFLRIFDCITPRYIPEDGTLYNHHYKHTKFYIYDHRL
jgi:hypothetical protein